MMLLLQFQFDEPTLQLTGVQTMHAQELPVQEQYRNVKPIQAQPFEILLARYVDHFQAKATGKLGVQLVYQVIAQRTSVPCVQRQQWQPIVERVRFSERTGKNEIKG